MPCPPTPTCSSTPPDSTRFVSVSALGDAGSPPGWKPSRGAPPRRHPLAGQMVQAPDGQDQVHPCCRRGGQGTAWSEDSLLPLAPSTPPASTSGTSGGHRSRYRRGP